jgi:HSP20 family protein
MAVMEEVAMSTMVKRDRRGLQGLQGLLDWLEGELPTLTALRWPDQPHLMACEEYEDEGRIVIRAQLPGLDPDEDIDVTVVGGALTINAVRREEHRERAYSEFFYGKLGRTLTLPPGVDEKAVAATYTDGVLEVTVTLPADRASTGAKVPVQRGE